MTRVTSFSGYCENFFHVQVRFTKREYLAPSSCGFLNHATVFIKHLLHVNDFRLNIIGSKMGRILIIVTRLMMEKKKILKSYTRQEQWTIGRMVGRKLIMPSSRFSIDLSCYTFQIIAEDGATVRTWDKL